MACLMSTNMNLKKKNTLFLAAVSIAQDHFFFLKSLKKRGKNEIDYLTKK